MSQAPFRRIVTGHNSDGKAILIEDGAPPRTARIGGEVGPIFYEVWNTRETPAVARRVLLRREGVYTGSHRTSRV